VDIKEYEERLKAIEHEAGAKKKTLAAECEMSNNTVKIGDVIEDHMGFIQVEKFSVQIPSFGRMPICAYFGIEITKAGTPSKKGTKRWVYQSNLKI
jgi:hypothetical protein